MLFVRVRRVSVPSRELDGKLSYVEILAIATFNYNYVTTWS